MYVCIYVCIVPDKMKIAKVIPLFKSGDNNIYKNYRPWPIVFVNVIISEKSSQGYIAKIQYRESTHHVFKN